MNAYYNFTPRHNASITEIIEKYATGSHFYCYYSVLSKSTAPTVVSLAERAMQQMQDRSGDYFGYAGEVGQYNGQDCTDTTGAML